MKEKHLPFLACPACKADLRFNEIRKKTGDEVEEGGLLCLKCGKKYEILRHVPRFVPLDNYASGFGFEWTRHSRTQYDSQSGANISAKRFFEETGWEKDLHGQCILEVGSGSGRFTEPASSTGAMVISLDYSYAVDANYASNGRKDNVLIVQADIYSMPVREEFFDKLFCFGVLQHTPDVEKSFKTLPRYLKSGGRIAVDVYRKNTGLKGLFMTKYWVRPLVKGVSNERLYALCKKYIRVMWPLTRIFSRVPGLGRYLNTIFLIPNYQGVFDLSDSQLREWAVLDLFDILSPAYDQPQTLDTMNQWFTAAGLQNIDVKHGYNGIEGRGRKPGE